MAFFTAILGTIIKSVITGFAISKAVSWLAPKPELPDFTQDAEATGVLVNKQSNNANIPVIYGTRLVGGTRVFLETSGNDNQYLYGALVLCEGEINGITKIYVEDKEVTFSGSLVMVALSPLMIVDLVTLSKFRLFMELMHNRNQHY